MVQMITNRIYAVVGTMRTVNDRIDAADPSTADLLHGIIDALEKGAWPPIGERRRLGPCASRAKEGRQMTGIGVRGGASPARAILWPSRALWRCSSRYGLSPPSH